MADQLRVCQIPVSHAECEEVRRKNCLECPHRDNCDCAWISELWEKENKLNGKDSLLGAYIPGATKDNIREGHLKTFGDGKDNFVSANPNIRKGHLTIYELYIDDCARGKGLSRKILNALAEENPNFYLFAKCVRGSSAESFWEHVAKREHPTMNTDPDDWYEHRIDKNGNPKRDVAWFSINKPEVKSDNTFKKQLW